ncbi:MAG: DUF7484 family protein [Peptostreptococcaceae bacterium]
MMNINELIDRIKKRIGLNGILRDIYTDEVIYDSIINVSLNTLNNMHGFYIVADLDCYVNNWSLVLQVNNMSNASSPTSKGLLSWNDATLTIPKELMDKLTSLGSEVRNVMLTTSRLKTYYAGYSHNIVNDLSSLHQQQRYQANTSKPDATFKAPNSIVLKDYGRIRLKYNGYKLRIQITHPKNLSTITRGIAQTFEDLCMYDIMVNIYNNDLALLNIDLGNSRVEVGMEQFTSASADRTALLEKFREKTLIDEIKIF